MKKKTIILICLTWLLSACSCPSPCDECPDNTEASLAEASYAVSRSISSLSATAQAAHPLQCVAAPAPPGSYGMGGLATVDWSGPIEPIVRQIARVTGYRVNVLGTEPAIPVLVTLYDKNRMLGDILRDIGYQAGRRATVMVYPENRVIEIQYAKN